MLYCFLPFETLIQMEKTSETVHLSIPKHFCTPSNVSSWFGGQLWKWKINFFSHLPLTWTFCGLAYPSIAVKIRTKREEALLKVGNQNYTLNQTRPHQCFLWWHLHFFVSTSSPHEAWVLPSPSSPLFCPANKLPPCMTNFCCIAWPCSSYFSHFCLSSPQGQGVRCLCVSVSLCSDSVFQLCVICSL